MDRFAPVITDVAYRIVLVLMLINNYIGEIVDIDVRHTTYIIRTILCLYYVSLYIYTSLKFYSIEFYLRHTTYMLCTILYLYYISLFIHTNL